MNNTKASAIYFSAGVTAICLAGALLTVLVAEAFFTIMPCHLCLQQRWPYYLGAALALVLSTLAHYRRVPLLALKIGMLLLVALLGWSLYLGVHHSGVEWGWWPGPADCTRSGSVSTNVTDLLARMKAQRVVPCDVAWRLLGLVSFANMNAVVSALLLALNAGVLAGFDPRKTFRK